MLTKEQILARNDLPTEIVEIQEWGGSVKLRGLSAGEREALEQEVTNKQGKVETKNLRAKLLVRSIVNENNEKIFTEADIDALNTKSSFVIDKLFLAAQRLNGMSNDAIEEMKGNS